MKITFSPPQIVSSIATYLVVLVQFKLTEEETMRNSTTYADTSQYSQYGMRNAHPANRELMKV
jgi:hypothetical protein